MRIVSWNIQGERERWSRGHTMRVLDVLAGSGADIFALQEVHRATWKSRGIDQHEEIGRRLGMQGIFGETLGSQSRGYGLSIFSNIAASQTRRIPLAGGGEQRIVLEAKLVNGLSIFVTHLAAWGRFMRRSRAAQVRQLVEILTASERAVLAGDFNAHPDSPELAPLRSSGLLVPCFEEHPITHPFSGGSLDAVLVTPSVRFISAACGTQRVSDHLPLTVTIELP